MTLHHLDGLNYLHQNPFEYYVHTDQHHHKDAWQVFLLDGKNNNNTLQACVQLNDGDRLDAIAIPNVVSRDSSSLKHSGPAAFWIQLTGNSIKNKWMIGKCTLACSPMEPLRLSSSLHS
ncbi:hypothetical protein BCR42DRAFT_443175 [Absidia repens]|uniref:Uncharacterized protein n=1 Tax=Absidia repens TaxID=90262 RepID=A0A1X2I0C1_9FUNG|nr:hypothetical protein BCR42DRAFT_443175 [Absidia repens]